MEYESLQDEEGFVLKLTKDPKKDRIIVSSSVSTIRSIQNYWEYVLSQKEHFFVKFSAHPHMIFSWKVPGTFKTDISYNRLNIQALNSRKPYISILFHPVSIRVFIYYLGKWIPLEKRFELKWNFSSKRKASFSLVLC